MKSKKLAIGLLVMLALVVTTGTFAFWASGVTGSNDSATGTVTIGTGDAVTTTVTVGNETSTGPLVPVGFEGGSDVNNVDLIFEIDWDGTGAEGATGTLVVTVDSIEVGGTDYSGLFTVDVSSQPSITAGTLFDYTVNVEFTNEPADQAEYDAVAGNDVVVTLTFTVNAD
jgi:hypothetical protein